MFHKNYNYKIRMPFFLLILCFNTVFAAEKDITINIYGDSLKVDSEKSSKTNIGFMYDSENTKIKLEGTNDSFKSGLVLKFNPYDSKWYVKVGSNYIYQDMNTPNSSRLVNQYSGAFATGYMPINNLYLELGVLYSKQNITETGFIDKNDSENSRREYLEVAKRWESSFGIVDTTFNYGNVDSKDLNNVSFYGGGISYYPTNSSKLSFVYSNEKNNSSSIYDFQYGMFFVGYTDNISDDTYTIKAGLKVVFNDLFDFSTYKSPTNIKSHLTELDKFETLTFSTNMNIQLKNEKKDKEPQIYK